MATLWQPASLRQLHFLIRWPHCRKQQLKDLAQHRMPVRGSLRDWGSWQTERPIRRAIWSLSSRGEGCYCESVSGRWRCVHKGVTLPVCFCLHKYGVFQGQGLLCIATRIDCLPWCEQSPSLAPPSILARKFCFACSEARANFAGSSPSTACSPQIFVNQILQCLEVCAHALSYATFLVFVTRVEEWASSNWRMAIIWETGAPLPLFFYFMFPMLLYNTWMFVHYLLIYCSSTSAIQRFLYCGDFYPLVIVAKLSHFTLWVAHKVVTSKTQRPMHMDKAWSLIRNKDAGMSKITRNLEENAT